MRSVTIPWIGGEHEFMLPLLMLEILEQRCDASYSEIFESLNAGMASSKFILQTIALGLEGGGMEKMQAVNLARSQYEDHGLDIMAATARDILAHSCKGWPSKDVGEDGAGSPENPKD